MSLFTVLATSKVAAGVLAAGTLAVGGTGVAAVSGVLPADAQQTAHELLGAPAPKLAAERYGRCRFRRSFRQTPRATQQ